MKKILIIGTIILVIVFSIILLPKLVEKDNNDETMNRVSDVLYNNETNMYYITDENGEIIHESEDEVSLYIYTIDPDYDPKNSDFIENDNLEF